MDNHSSSGIKPTLSETSKPCDEAWKSILQILARELSEQSFKTWFDPITCLDITDENIVLGVPDNYFGQWVKTHYENLITSAIKESIGGEKEIIYRVSEIKKITPEPSPLTKEKNDPRKSSKNENRDRPISADKQKKKLNINYTFDNFVIGPGNRFAHAAALAICDAPAKQYNPLFIYGGVGLGKTHLMQSTAHEIKQRNPQFNVLYISSEKFTNQLINAIQTRSTSQFRSRYRNLDLLLIDDIHFLAEKEATQEEFFHTFNTLYDAHKQIIVSSDRAPREIPGLEERLVSRFGWGLVTDIQPPDFETRVAILKKKIEKEPVTVSDEVLFFIASKIKSNIRELEGALIRVVAYCTLTGHPLTLKAAQEILQASLKEEEKNVSIEQIQRTVADYFNLKLSDLRSKRRTRSVVKPRQLAMYLIRSLTSHSFPEIGEYFGGRDHTTVLHGYNKINEEIKKDEAFKHVVEEIKDMLKK